MKFDPHNCRHEAEQEQIELDALDLHLAGECAGAPVCGYCLDAQERGAESLGD